MVSNSKAKEKSGSSALQSTVDVQEYIAIYQKPHELMP